MAEADDEVSAVASARDRRLRMDPDDEFDEASEQAWVTDQRTHVAGYLRREGVKRGEIGEWPAWHVQPYLAIWAVESLKVPGRMGWWAIRGDVPTDYVPFSDATDHPREAMRYFARQWAEVSAHMLRGEPHPETTIGTPEDWPELGDLLHRRSTLLIQFAEDDSLWENF